ncbi:type VI secretion system lipoprotein TssJ [Uliginosibacterium sp. H3]|uniref:Type VI secretion system lipoprotein TssJ n=1 Tax=Uliginosibacterium silvisoli TaxID=3114758 RepID=A0ABU6K5X6_9RHOO|nr:type VI secretion system lipoprotein TssJ [Uliginosibacterium sp. H3]
MNIKFAIVVVSGVFISGCAATGAIQVATAAASTALEIVGLVKPSEAKPEALKEVPLNIFAGAGLNTDAQGRSNAVVVKLYRLRNNASFLGTSYETLMDPAREKATLGQDLLDVREVMLVPGQKLEFKEKLPADTAFLAVAALFRAPSTERWRYTFPVDAANAKGVIVGVHGCALTVSQGNVSGAKINDVSSLTGVRCQP